MESKRLTAEELEVFKASRQEASSLAAVLGELHFQRTLLDLELENVKEAVKVNALKQRDHLKILGEKYGNGTIDPETGNIHTS